MVVVFYIPNWQVKGLLIFVPIIFLWLETFLQACLYRITYIIGISYHILNDYIHYLDSKSLVHHIGLYLVTLFCLIVPFLLLWPAKKIKPVFLKTSYILLIFALITLPPIGLLSLNYFLVSMGALFPSLGWYGVTLYIILFFAILYSGMLPSYRKFTIPVVLLLALVVFASNYSFKPPKTPTGWQEVNTNRGKSDQKELFSLNEKTAPIAKHHISKNTKVIILPEASAVAIDLDGSIQSIWEPTFKKAKKYHTNIIFGGLKLIPFKMADKKQFGYFIWDNKKLAFKPSRQPIPLISWFPWKKTSQKATWFKQNNFALKNQNVQVSVCYESFVPWFLLHPFMQRNRPTILIGINNLYFANKKTIESKHMMISSVARLFNVPLIEATNY